MRLLFVHEWFGSLAGAEANVLNTASELRRRGHTLALLHRADTGHGEAAWKECFPERFPITELNGATVDLALNTFRPDAIYLHNLEDVDAMEELSRSSIPVVRMVHDHRMYCLRSCRYPAYTRKICTRPLSMYCVFPCGGVVSRNRDGGFPLQWISYLERKRELELNRHFQRMIVASDYMKEELLRNGFDAQQIEIHAPVPRNTEPSFSCTFSDRNRIVYAGQIARGKGVDILLESLALVRAPFECVILGDGHHRDYCERLSDELGLTDRVTFYGYLPQDQIREFYRDSSISVMSSVWPEPFGAVGLEAMRCGLPVVAFDAGGIREWLIDGHNGFLAPWMDRARYAERIEQLLADKTLARKLGEQGRQLASQRFDFTTYVNGLEKLFTQVMEERPCLPVTSTLP